MNRRSFIINATWGAASLTSLPLYSCKNTNVEKATSTLKLSLAQWSLNQAFFAKRLDVNDFADIAINDYGINAIEYVNQFYKELGEDEKFWISMKERADKAEVKNLLIMVDAEGDLGAANSNARKQAVENHFKWVNAAKILGCHSIRVNAFGTGNKEELRSALIDGMGQLVEYAGKENINILIENHGLQSSDAKFITSIIKEVGQPNFGTLPDFGNWCTNEKWGGIRTHKCKEEHDLYAGVKEFLPYAKGVSAKAYNFDKDDNETYIDYRKMIKIIKNAGFAGYIGIEYEGGNLSEPDGIKATKKLLEKTWEEIE